MTVDEWADRIAYKIAEHLEARCDNVLGEDERLLIRSVVVDGLSHYTTDTMAQLWHAVDKLWGRLPVAEVIATREEDPALVELAKHAHHRMSHEQRMMT